MQYDSKSKYHWRRWQWNRIEEKLKRCIPRRRRHDWTALYLAGPEDHDRALAKEFGFQDYNLIAIDRDQSCIDNVRKHGGIGICGDLDEIVLLWPHDWPVDVIVADFVCGLEVTVLSQFFDMMDYSGVVMTNQTIISTNWQRGRDSTTTDWRKALGEWGDLILSLHTQSEDFRLAFSDVHKNRAKGFLATYFYHFWKRYMRGALSECGDQLPGFSGPWTISHVIKQFIRDTAPSFHSYRQAPNRPYMDTVVFSALVGAKTMTPARSLRCFLSKMEGGSGPCPSDSVLAQYQPKANHILHKIAAARAVRTMRMNGKL